MEPNGGNVKDDGGHEKDEDITMLVVEDVSIMSFGQQEFEEMAKTPI